MLPQVPYTRRNTVEQAIAFGGINYNFITSAGEFSDSMGISTSEYPALTTRKGRQQYGSFDNASNLYSREKLITVRDSVLYWGDDAVYSLTGEEKQFATINTKVVIFPDKIYLDTTDGTVHQLEAGIESLPENVTITTNSITVTGADMESLFKAFDTVTVSGTAKNDGDHNIKSVSGNTLVFGDNVLEAETPTNSVTISRHVPKLEYICEKDNRIWGVAGPVIYASALGDPTNFFQFSEADTDSYADAVGSDSAFTGIVAFNNSVWAFKEHIVHRVLGSNAGEYYMQDYHIPGLESGSSKSLKVVNEVLYYKGIDGVYSLAQGSLPVLITGKFGGKRYSNACAGSDNTHYYISMQDTSGNWHLFSYDIARGIWIREGDERVSDFTYLDRLYILCDGKVYGIGYDEALIPWSFVMQFGYSEVGKKDLTDIAVKVKLTPGAWMKAEIQMNDGRWKQVFIKSDQTQHSFVGLIAPGRCDDFKVRFSGEGKFEMYSMALEYKVVSK